VKPAALRRVDARAGMVGLLGVTWLGLGLLVGWFVGYLADQLVLPAHHLLIYAALGLSGAVLCGWAYGTRLLYLEVRAGLDEAMNGAPLRRRTGYAWTAALAAPIVGMLLTLSSHSVPHPAAGGGCDGRAGDRGFRNGEHAGDATGLRRFAPSVRRHARAVR
jgi:hypothetical protein